MDARDNQIEELKTQVREMSNRLEELAGSAQEVANGYIKDLPKTIQHGIDSTKEAANKAGSQVQEYASENPWHIAAIAAGLGFLIATLNHRNDR